MHYVAGPKKKKRASGKNREKRFWSEIHLVHSGLQTSSTSLLSDAEFMNKVHVIHEWGGLIDRSCDLNWVVVGDEAFF